MHMQLIIIYLVQRKNTYVFLLIGAQSLKYHVWDFHDKKHVSLFGRSFKIKHEKDF